MKKVSVVVPCYNASMYLDKCLEYLLHQTIGIENIEIILVNDASTDDGATWNLITQYEQNYPDTIIAVNLEENLRQGGARNVGVSYAGGEYLIFCDADDWLLHETLEHCYRIAKEYDTDVVEFLIKDIRDHEMTVSLEKGDGDFLIDLAAEEARGPFLLYIDNQLTLGSQKKFYRTSLIQDNKITFAEHLIFEEPSFMLPVRLYEKRHYFLDEKLYICFLSQGSTMRSDWEKEHKWDNPKVWMRLIEDLSVRGFLEPYHDEIEYLFFQWGLGLSLQMIQNKGCEVNEEELKYLVNITLALFPGIRQNKYIMVSVNNIESEDDRKAAELLALLDMETADKEVNMDKHIMRKQLDTFLAEGNYEACRNLLLSNEEVVDNVNELVIAKCMVMVCEQEKEEGMQTLFEKVKSLDELLRRYTKLMFYIRRLDLGIMDDGMDEFRQFLAENRVSTQELFIVLHCGAVHKERALQIVKDKMLSGEIVL